MGDEINVHLDQFTMLAPVISASILGAYYSALLLKQLSGTTITPDAETDTLTEVFSVGKRLQPEIIAASKTEGPV